MLILVRHGRTAANAEGRLQGRLDQPLDDVGREQAAAVASAVHAIGAVDWVISSPLQRARQTAEALGGADEIDERWAELAYGRYEGVPHADVPSEIWTRWRQDLGYVPEGGESLLELDARVRAACEELIERASTTTVVVVSHVSPIKSAVAWALGVDIGISWNCHLDHATVCRIAFRNRRPLLQTFNETAGPGGHARI
jgi:broad specificity phosphatase PhoE